MQEYFEIGQIVNTYGIKGFVKVVPFTDDIKRFENLKTIYIDFKGNLILMTIDEVSYSKTNVLLKFKEAPDINMVEKYKGCYLKIKRAEAVKLPENSYFIADLIGIEVQTEDGRVLGNVDDIFKTGSNDVYVVKDDLGKQILLPAIKEVIKTIDIENKKMIVNLIKGLE
ncbi:MAG: ribosome maturation factor RimM [Clostridia bacterium]|nr:ribosome maturation factor RimM [Clostridia bacterium]